MAPKGWSKKKLSELGKCIRGVSYDPDADLRESDTTETVRLLRAGNIDAGRILHEDLQYVQRGRCSAEQVMRRGDMAICMSSGSKGLVGKAAPYFGDNGYDYCVGAFCALFRPHKSAVPGFVRHLFETEQYRRWMHVLLAGSYINNLKPSDIEGLSFLVPDSPEERKAVACRLDAWDARLTQTSDLVRRLEERRDGLTVQLLTGKKRLPGFADHWKAYKIGQLLRQVKRYVDWDDSQVYSLLSIRRRSGGLFHREDRLGADIKTKVMKVTREGDFVIAKMQVLHGALAMTKDEHDGMHVSDSYLTFIPRKPELLHMPYFDYLSRTPGMYYKAWRSSYGVAIEKMTFNLPWYLEEEVTIPPTLDEQRRVTAVLDAADREIDLLRGEVELLRKQKLGVMQKLLTGEKRIRT